MEEMKYCDRCGILSDDLKSYQSTYHFYREICESCISILSREDKSKKRDQERSEEKASDAAERTFRRKLNGLI